jgi:hypothetical protein
MTRGIAKGWVTMALIVSSGCTASGEQSAEADRVAVWLGCGVGVSVGKAVRVGGIGLVAACWADGTGSGVGCVSGSQAAQITTITIHNILDILFTFDLKTPFRLVWVRMESNFKINFTAV